MALGIVVPVASLHEVIMQAGYAADMVVVVRRAAAPHSNRASRLCSRRSF